jgi:S1-C subfamily serine protease
MNLNELFTKVNPAIVCFANRLIPALPGGGKPAFPEILGTGFLIDSNGMVATNRHVIAAFKQAARRADTDEFSIAAIGFYPDNQGSWQMLVHELFDWYAIGKFESSGEWFGDENPDIGFVQLNVTEMPYLSLATEDYAIRVGMNVATVGYPMGTIPLTAMGKLSQASPFIRQGIVSSVFPYPIPQPQGFTIDIMQQGGSSGSPILDPETGNVIGLMKASVLDYVYVPTQAKEVLAIQSNTNISIIEPAHIISAAYEHFKTAKRDVPLFETLAEKRAKYPKEEAYKEMQWETITIPRPNNEEDGRR